MTIFVYTFRTFPYIKELNDNFGKVFVLGKLKEDLDSLFKEILSTNPKVILGIAKSNNEFSYFETKTINQFNKSKKVVKESIEEYPLFVPSLINTNFQVSLKATDSFCNYSMFKIQHFLKENNSSSKLAFCHIAKENIDNLSIILPK